MVNSFFIALFSSFFSSDLMVYVFYPFFAFSLFITIPLLIYQFFRR